jgi:hypothetical protein
MPTAFLFELHGVTQQQYEALMRDLDLGGHPAPGNHFHVAGPMEGGWWALDVWESPERLQQYVNQKLGPAMAKHHFPQIQPKMMPVMNMLK